MLEVVANGNKLFWLYISTCLTLPSASAAASIVFMSDSSTTLDTPKVRVAALLAWITNLFLYSGLTAGIAYRLAWAEMRISSIRAGSGRYKSAMRTIVESGSIFAGATAVVLILVLVRHPWLLAATSPTTQLAVRNINSLPYLEY